MSWKRFEILYTIGSLNDFIGVPGLANFVGHMVLQAGDQKYPEQNALREFVEAHGGTVYLPRTGLGEQKLFFEIKHAYLTESLERLV